MEKALEAKDYMHKFRVVDELTKVLPTVDPGDLQPCLSGLKGEKIAFQFAWYEEKILDHRAPALTIEIEVVGSVELPQVSQVKLVPVQLPSPPGKPEEYMVHEPTILPDLLLPLEPVSQGAQLATYTLRGSHVGWNSVWVDLSLPADEVVLVVKCAQEELYHRSVRVKTVDVSLPKPDITVTQWFHVDGLANYYGVPVWSERHWQAIENQIDSVAKMGINSVLVPLWTAPLDTAEGKSRLSTQLLEISGCNKEYCFDFSRVDRWMEIMLARGICSVEVPPFFTQWGARACPHFEVKDRGMTVKKFGWETEATSGEYREFIVQLIPALQEYFAKWRTRGLKDVFYHVSDEPNLEHLQTYKAARAMVADLLEGEEVIDALSDPDFQTCVGTPVVATSAVSRFRDQHVEPSWVYYCISQNRHLANRFIAQKPIYHRLLGIQLYKFKVKGFLHWAFNFYNTQYSLDSVDPFFDTSTGGAFISGDSFIVYPAPDGKVWESLRHRMVGAAFRDMALFAVAEKMLGREEVLNIMDPADDVDYDSGWISSAAYMDRRDKLLRKMAQN